MILDQLVSKLANSETGRRLINSADPVTLITSSPFRYAAAELAADGLAEYHYNTVVWKTHASGPLSALLFTAGCREGTAAVEQR